MGLGNVVIIRSIGWVVTVLAVGLGGRGGGGGEKRTWDNLPLVKKY